MYRPEKELFLVEFCGGDDMMQKTCLRNCLCTAEGGRHSQNALGMMVEGQKERERVSWGKANNKSKVIDARKHGPGNETPIGKVSQARF